MDLREDIGEKAREISKEITARIGAGGSDLRRQIRRAGRRLPKSVQRDALMIANAASFSDHPKLFKQVNPVEVASAHKRVMGFLETIDASDKRQSALLSWLGDNVVNLLIVGAVLITVLIWRGFI